MNTIAENIKELRKNYSLTQGQLGEIAGVTDKAVSTWENGVAVPRMSAAKRISEHFGISISEILEGAFDESRYDINARVLAIAKTVDQDPELSKALEVLRKKPAAVAVVNKLGMLTADELQLIEQMLGKFYSVRTKK